MCVNSHNKNRMTHPLRVAKNYTTHPLPRVQKLMTHPLSAPAHPPYTFGPVPIAHLDHCKSCVTSQFGIWQHKNLENNISQVQHSKVSSLLAIVLFLAI